MPSIYYKDSNNDWVLLDLGSVQKGVFTATTSNYSYNFEEAYTGYVPIVVANALGSQEVKVTSVSPTGFIIQVEGNAVPCDIMFFAARGEAIPTFEEANGKQLLDYYLEQSKKLGLIINPKKTFYNKITHPFLFCKIRYTKLADGSVRRNVRKPQTRYSMKHIKNVIRKSKTEPSIDLVPVHASFYGYLKRGDANLERLLDKAFEDCDLSF